MSGVDDVPTRCTLPAVLASRRAPGDDADDAGPKCAGLPYAPGGPGSSLSQGIFRPRTLRALGRPISPGANCFRLRRSRTSDPEEKCAAFPVAASLSAAHPPASYVRQTACWVLHR